MGLGEKACSSVLYVYLKKEAQCTSNKDIHKGEEMDFWVKI